MRASTKMAMGLLLVLACVQWAAAGSLPAGFLSPGAECSAAAAAAPLAALWASGPICPQQFCSSTAQCEAACPSALTAVCSGGTCHFTYSGGGSGGRVCQHRFCTSSSQCTCSDGSFGVCSGGVCQF